MPDGLAHHTLTPEKPRQSRSAKPGKRVAPSLIVEAALRIKAMIDREDYLDGKRAAKTPAEEAEEDGLYHTRVALAEQITFSTPETGTEALIVVMHAADRLNFGSAINEGHDIIDACERAIRRALTVLVRELKVDLVPFGSEDFLLEHLSQNPAGVCVTNSVPIANEEDQEICMMLHSLWWQARERRLARAERAEAQVGRA